MLTVKSAEQCAGSFAEMLVAASAADRPMFSIRNGRGKCGQDINRSPQQLMLGLFC